MRDAPVDNRHTGLVDNRQQLTGFVMGKSPKNQCFLTDAGREALELGLRLKFPGGCSDTELAQLTGLHRQTIAKIRNQTSSSNLQSLEKIFCWFEDYGISLNIDEHICFETSSTNPKVKESKSKSRKDNPAAQRLREKLIELNYANQRAGFCEAVGRLSPCASFLIVGEYGRGQKWLVNRLAEEVPSFGTQSYKVPLTITSDVNLDLDIFWEKLSDGLEADSNPTSICQKIYDKWKTQTVILALYGVDFFADCLPALIEQVWCPLIQKTTKVAANLDISHPIVLFLVDESGSDFQEQLSVLSSGREEAPAYLPVILPCLEPFSDGEIRQWFGKCTNLFEAQTQKNGVKRVLNGILKRKKHPIQTLQTITQCAGVAWDEVEKGLVL